MHINEAKTNIIKIINYYFPNIDPPGYRKLYCADKLRKQCVITALHDMVRAMLDHVIKHGVKGAKVSKTEISDNGFVTMECRISHSRNILFSVRYGLNDYPPIIIDISHFEILDFLEYFVYYTHAILFNICSLEEAFIQPEKEDATTK